MQKIETKPSYPKDFNFRVEFSSKDDGTTYNPWRNTNESSNISNYIVHKISIAIYNCKNKKVISYIIKGINAWLIVRQSFVKPCNFRKDFLIVGIVPQFKYWTRKTSDTILKKFNCCSIGTKIFQEMIDLEKHDMSIWINYENKLTKLFDKAILEREKKIKTWDKVRAYLELENKVIEEQETIHNLTPDYENLQETDKDPPLKEYNSEEWLKICKKSLGGKVKKN